MSLSEFHDRFAENFRLHGELGAAVAVWSADAEVLSLAAGFADPAQSIPWSTSTLVPIWSATKGIAALAFCDAMHQNRISLEAQASHLWPEFAAEGKADITLGQILSHQSGLPFLDEPIPDALDFLAVEEALARQTPAWKPGSAHGYHPRTVGYLLDAILRRATAGETIGSWWNDRLRPRLDAEVWIGLPEPLLSQVAPLRPAAGQRFDDSAAEAFQAALKDPNSLTSRALRSPRGLHSVRDMNQPAAHRAALPALTGVASARGLAKVYGILANPERTNALFGPTLFSSATQRLVNGFDLIFRTETAFSAGWMLDPLGSNGPLRSIFGLSPRAFGHPGAGGSHAFADPDLGIGFAYVMNQMELGLLPNPKSLRLVELLPTLGTP